MRDDETAEWSRKLKAEWEERAQSPLRDFFIASHRGWDDEAVWNERARGDVEFALSRLDAGWLSRAACLEIGCGVGRLVPALRPRVTSYTGLDISAAIVAEARRRCDGMDGVRFFESDGDTVGAEASDRTYDLILVFAVFIHCPESVIRSTLVSALGVLAPGGKIRFSLRADGDDHEGIQAPRAHVEKVAANVDDTLRQLTDLGGDELVHDRSYTGDAFTYAGAKALVSEIFGERSNMLYRTDLSTIYAEVTNDAEGG